MNKKTVYQVYSDVEWLYPDTLITNPFNTAELHCARNSDVCFQVLSDLTLDGSEPFSVETEGLDCTITVYQLKRVYVSENSGDKVFTTTDYDSVKHFVTRKAPFHVYDITEEIQNGSVFAERGAFFLRFDIAKNASVGAKEGSLTLKIGSASLVIPVRLTVYNASVPSLTDASFHMVNWLYYDKIAKDHSCEPYSKEYMDVLENYINNQIDMRNDYLMLPSGEPIKDENGTVVDFDFSKAETVGNLALKKGFNYVMGGFASHWNHWDEPELYLLWDKTISVSSIEGYRQLKLYFTRAYESVVKNGWLGKYMQCMVDEPQFENCTAYRTLGAICRQNMPGIKINDPIETTDIGGALDIWVVKQAIYEKYLQDFQKIQSYGEEMWLYTCGFPAGATMNRIMDLPLTVSRLPMWLCFKYNCPGFLHWGYHFSSKEALLDGATDAPGRVSTKYPPGNAHVVYLSEKRPIYSVRGHAQRTGAVDYELFNLLAKKDKATALEIIESVCRSFDDYDPSASCFENARIKLLKALG